MKFSCDAHAAGRAQTLAPRAHAHVRQTLAKQAHTHHPHAAEQHSRACTGRSCALGRSPTSHCGINHTGVYTGLNMRNTDDMASQLSTRRSTPRHLIYRQSGPARCTFLVPRVSRVIARHSHSPKQGSARAYPLCQQGATGTRPMQHAARCQTVHGPIMLRSADTLISIFAFHARTTQPQGRPNPKRRGRAAACACMKKAPCK